MTISLTIDPSLNSAPLSCCEACQTISRIGILKHISGKKNIQKCQRDVDTEVHNMRVNEENIKSSSVPKQES